MSATATRSYCCECDAAEGCDHFGPRYLEPIRYELVEGNDAKSFRWRIPDAERARIESPSSSWLTRAQRPSTAAPEPLPLLIDQVSRVAYLDDQLEGQLVELYAIHPLAITQLVAAVLDGAATGRIHHPAGVLATRLKSLAGRIRRPEPEVPREDLGSL